MSGSLRRRRAIYTSAAPEPSFSTGSTPAATSGTMILRIDDTDVDRNTAGLARFHLRRPEMARPGLGRALSPVRAPRPASPGGLEDLRERPGLSRLHARRGEDDEKEHAGGPWLFNPGDARTIAPKKATAAPTPASLSCCASACRARAAQAVEFHDAVYGAQSKISRRYRRLRPAPQQRRADVSHGLLRRRCRSQHQPHHPRPGPSHQHLQARPDLRSGRARRRPRSRICRC